ncbi:zinc finger protein OZF-like [Sabethes cyaneus]|uniref:zinc finger protein OZF-like n=1 Tax=Sabethes cyaneus TaxID=53552 RepID=UPI00237EB71A|nr:zinc finger protein OZF-like [Sabethes cyaneus]
MENLSSVKNEYKVCQICTQSILDEGNLLTEIINGVTLESMIQDIFTKLKISADDNRYSSCCVDCKEELIVAYRFIRKVIAAHPKQLNCSLSLNVEQSDPLINIYNEPEASIKSEDEADDTQFQLDIYDLEDESKPSTVLFERSYEKMVAEEVSEDEKYMYSDQQDESSESESDEEIQTSTKRNKPQRPPQRCCDCSEPLSTVEQVQEHSVKFHKRNKSSDSDEIEQKPYECSVCFQRFETNKNFLQHQRKMYSKALHYCRRCPESFANAFNLREHHKAFHKRVKIIEQIDEMRQKIHKCCVCRKQFDTRELLLEHGKKAHIPHPESQDPKNQFVCEVCSRRFKSDKILIEHQRRPYRKHRFQCAQCGKTYKDKRSFSDHEQSHANIRKYECHLCDKRFALKPNFLTHVKYHSIPDDQFKCKFCNRGFKKKHLLQEHSVIHSDREDRPFKCHLCPNTFTRQDRLDFHIKAHLGEKPFKCTRCSSSYIHERDLRRHNRTKHEEVRPFVCNVCSKAFNRKDAYGKHMKTHSA